MKKISLLLFIAASTLSFAQTHFGIKAGYINSSLDWKDSPSSVWEDFTDYSSKSYFYAGGFVEHFVSKKVSVQGELIYTQIGGKSTIDMYQFVGNEWIQTGTMDAKFKYTQLQVPLSAKYYFIDKLAVSGGLNFAFNIDSKVKIDDIGTGDIENVKTLNFNPFIGAEYHITKNIYADARYNFGISNINKEGLDVRSSFFQIGLGYRFK